MVLGGGVQGGKEDRPPMSSFDHVPFYPGAWRTLINNHGINIDSLQ